MKKYIKPELFYERYELAQHIADCDWELVHPDMNTCIAHGEEDSGYEDNILFMSTISCEWTADNGMYEDYCYQPGSEGQMTVFNS